MVLGLLGPLGAAFAGFFVGAVTSPDPDEVQEAPQSTDQSWNGALLDDLGDVNISEDFLPKADDFSDPNAGDLTFDASAAQDTLRENRGDDGGHGGSVRALRCRSTDARDTSKPAQEALRVFLNGDDRFRLIQAAAGGIRLIGLGHFGLQRVNRSLFGTARAGKATPSGAAIQDRQAVGHVAYRL